MSKKIINQEAAAKAIIKFAGAHGLESVCIRNNFEQRFQNLGDLILCSPDKKIYNVELCNVRFPLTTIQTVIQLLGIQHVAMYVERLDVPVEGS